MILMLKNRAAGSKSENSFVGKKHIVGKKHRGKAAVLSFNYKTWHFLILLSLYREIFKVFHCILLYNSIKSSPVVGEKVCSQSWW